MSVCLRASCGHPYTAHDEQGMCSLCSCAEFLREEDTTFDVPRAFVVDDEDEEESEVDPLDFDDEADR